MLLHHLWSTTIANTATATTSLSTGDSMMVSSRQVVAIRSCGDLMLLVIESASKIRRSMLVILDSMESHPVACSYDLRLAGPLLG